MIIKIRNSYIHIDKSLATEMTNLGKERIGEKGGSQRQIKYELVSNRRELDHIESPNSTSSYDF